MYSAIGFLRFALLPLADEVRQFAAVYRRPESMQRVAPVGMVALLQEVAYFVQWIGAGVVIALIYRPTGQIS